MLSSIHRRATHANVAMALALVSMLTLFFAMATGASAAPVGSINEFGGREAKGGNADARQERSPQAPTATSGSSTTAQPRRSAR